MHTMNTLFTINYVVNMHIALAAHADLRRT